MSGGGLLCPECGCEHKSERVLNRTRRKWKTAVVGLLLVGLVVYARANDRRIQMEGAVGLVPSYVLAIVCDADVNLGRGVPRKKIDRVFAQRLDMNLTSGGVRDLWAYKIASAWKQSPPVFGSGTEVRVFDLSPVVPVDSEYETWRGFVTTSFFTGLPMIWRSNHNAYGCASLLESHAQREVPNSSGTLLGCTHLVGDRLVVWGRAPVLDYIQNALDELHENSWELETEPVLFRGGQEHVHGLYRVSHLLSDDEATRAEQIRLLTRLVAERDLSGAWDVENGAKSSISPLMEGEIIVWAVPELHMKYMEYLNSVDLEALVDQ